ncbi:hypothetical protein ACP4OV_027747 [Aristida adscensionis]
MNFSDDPDRETAPHVAPPTEQQGNRKKEDTYYRDFCIEHFVINKARTMPKYVITTSDFHNQNKYISFCREGLGGDDVPDTIQRNASCSADIWRVRS